MILLSSEIRRICIFRALQLGDLLCAIPAVRALRSAYPGAEITLLGLPWAGSFVKRFDRYFDRFIWFPGYPGLPEQSFDEESFEDFVRVMQNEKFDLLIQMQGNGTIVNPLMMSVDARHVAGFYNDESYVGSPLFMPYPDYGPEKERHLTLMRHLGISITDSSLEFPLTAKDEQEYADLTLPLTREGYIIVHPGSRGTWRQWPPNYFAAIADIAINEGFSVVITGTEQERDITSEMIKCMHKRPIDLTGKTSLGTMGVLMRDAYALFANCTGVSHIADALNTRSIIISMDGEPQRWSPTDTNLHFVIDWTKDHSFDNVLSKTQELLEMNKTGQLRF